VALNGTKTVSPTATTTYTITVKGAGGTVMATAKVTVTVAPPTVTFSANPMSIEPGELSILSWTSANAISATIDQGIGEVDLNGSFDVSPVQTTQYTITVSNGSETAAASVTVTINQPQPQVSLNVFPEVVLPGEPAALCWQTENVDLASIDNGIGAVATQGSIQINPASPTTYTITATGLGGTTTASATVETDNTLQPEVSLYSSLQIVAEGGSIVLSWNVLHAESASIDNGIGSVSNKGSLRVTPGQSITYTITAGNRNGTASASVEVEQKSLPNCYAYIPNASSNTVSIIDVTDYPKTAKTIAVGNCPQSCAVRLDGMFAYIGNYDSQSISVIDTGTKAVVSTIAIGGDPQYLALHPGGKLLYAVVEKIVAGTLTYAIDVINSETGLVVKELALGNNWLHGLAFHPDGSMLYAAGSSKVMVIDTTSNEIMFNIPSTWAFDLALSPDGSRLYVIKNTNIDGENVSVIDTGTNTVIKKLTVPNSYGNTVELTDVVVHPDGTKFYVISGNDYLYKYLSCIDATTFAVNKAQGFQTLSPNSLGIKPDGSRAFVVSNGLYYFSTDPNNFHLDGSLSLGNGPLAYGNFIGNTADTVGGKVTQNNTGVAGVTLTITGEGITKTLITDASGDYVTNLKNGTYTITPSRGNDVFSPQSRQVIVNKSRSGQDFQVIDTTIPPTVTLSITPKYINVGSSATLYWTSTNAATAEIDNGVGNVLINGSITVTPSKTTTYKITVSNTVLTASATAKVTVTGSLPTVTISATPAAIQLGQSSTLSWTSTNATSASIDQGIGTVPVNGSQVVTPAATTTYTITVTDSYSNQATATATLTVSQYDTSAKLTGTVTDYSTSQLLADVNVSAQDDSGVPQTALTDATGKYTIANLRVGAIMVSFVKSGYDPYQQTINIPTNTTFELATQLRQTQVGATLHGLVKDGQTGLPLAGATVTAVFTGGSLTSTSGSDGAYSLAGIPLGVSTQITAALANYRSSTINLSFSQNGNYIWDFSLFNNSAVAVVQGKFINAKTLLPEAGVKVTHQETNASTITVDDGTFTFNSVLFGEQTFSFEKTDLINETLTYSIISTPFFIELIKPNRQGVQIRVGTDIGGNIKDLLTGVPLVGAVVKVPGLNLTATTDQNGYYSLSGLPEGNYPMVVMAVNHTALEVMATVVIGESSTANFSLYSLVRGLINGTITDSANGEPVAQASIEIDGNALLSATSEGDGTYKLVGIPPGTYKLKISQAGYGENSIENVEVQDMSPTTINVQLNRRPQTGALEGKILDIATGNPVSGASVTISGTSITATTDANGSYRLTNVPAGLNNLIVSATGYPSAPRIRAVNADESSSSPTTTPSDIYIDPNNGTVDEKVTKLITANEGGDIITTDSRFLLHIFPGTLSADANISLSEVIDGPNITIGSELPMDPALGMSGIKAASIMTQIEIAPVVQTDPVPTINGVVVIAARYSQKDTDDFQLDESTAFPYSWNESYFTALNPRPYELAVDKVNNIAYAAVDITTTTSGSSSQFSQHTLLKSDPVRSGSVLAIPWVVKKFILGKILKATVKPPKPNVKIFDKNELDCVTNAGSDQKPNPNALPLVFIHGFDPISTLTYLVTNPNSEERYKTMLEDIVAATNGVYRPVFVSYNTEAKITSIGTALAEKFYGEYLNKNNSIKGLPADPIDSDSGTFPYVDTFAFSMGGLVSRVFAYGNPTSRVHNMIMIGTPNHGTFSSLKYVKDIVKLLNVGAADQLDYNDTVSRGPCRIPFCMH
jgi:YVTN family beta-propeller protein